MFDLERMRPAWHAQAACRQWPAEWWFPKVGSNSLQALQICSSCPVRSACLEAAIREEADVAVTAISGVRGGLRADERRQLRRTGAG